MIWTLRIARLLQWALVLAGLGALAMAALLVFPVSPPAPVKSIRAGALAVDQSGRPDISRFQASDGSTLAYRLYPAANGDTSEHRDRHSRLGRSFGWHE